MAEERKALKWILFHFCFWGIHRFMGEEYKQWQLKMVIGTEGSCARWSWRGGDDSVGVYQAGKAPSRTNEMCNILVPGGEGLVQWGRQGGWSSGEGMGQIGWAQNMESLCAQQSLDLLLQAIGTNRYSRWGKWRWNWYFTAAHISL